METIKVQLSKHYAENKRALVDPETGIPFHNAKGIVLTPKTQFVKVQLDVGTLVRAEAETPAGEKILVRIIVDDFRIGKNEYAKGTEVEIKADFAAKLIEQGKAEKVEPS